MVRINQLPTPQPLSAGVATEWTLRRQHRQRRSAEQLLMIRRVMQHGRFLSPQVFFYRGRSVSLRPAVANMLRSLWQHGGEAFDAHAWFLATYHRVGTLRAVRQTAFRCSRAMEAVGCPIVIRCRGLKVYPHLLVRNFDRAPDAAAPRLAELA